MSKYGVRRGLVKFLEKARGAGLTACKECGATCEADQCLFSTSEADGSPEDIIQLTTPAPGAVEELSADRVPEAAPGLVQDSGVKSEGGKVSFSNRF